MLITSAQRPCTDGLTSESKTATERNFDSFGSLSATSRCFRGTQAVERLQLSALTRYCASSPNQSYSGTLALLLPRRSHRRRSSDHETPARLLGEVHAGHAR